MQDTFVKVWRKADSYEPTRGSLDTWVLLIARSLAIDPSAGGSSRRGARRAGGPAASRPRSGPEEQAETRDLAVARAQAMPLCPGQRAALELAYFGGKTSAEVAELEGSPSEPRRPGSGRRS